MDRLRRNPGEGGALIWWIHPIACRVTAGAVAGVRIVVRVRVAPGPGFNSAGRGRPCNPAAAAIAVTAPDLR